ncbi:diacylglycerol/lipid kinase family protein [Bifidobacterium panos]|nr:diacylglycerol kinase family protein [Bifidobacterium sp. DSM 109963]
MSELEKCPTVAMIGNPVANNGKGSKVYSQVFDLLVEGGKVHGFDVIDLTGSSFDDSLAKAREAAPSYDYLVVVGGDGMMMLGANAVRSSGKPLGIVAVGSGNDFARGLKLPVNRVQTAVEGIIGAIVRGSHIDVDMGCVTWPDDGGRDRLYSGMLSCGLDASINDRANHSRLPGGSLRYFVAVLIELTHIKRYGYHVALTRADGTIEERDMMTPLLTVANSRHIGGGIEVSPYSCLDDGLLDVVWMAHMPSLREAVRALRHAYDGRLLAAELFGWERVRDIEITRAQDGDEPPVLMADGEYVGQLPVKVRACKQAVRVLVPPAVADWYRSERSESRLLATVERDGRDPLTGGLVATPRRWRSLFGM